LIGTNAVAKPWGPHFETGLIGKSFSFQVAFASQNPTGPVTTRYGIRGYQISFQNCDLFFVFLGRGGLFAASQLIILSMNMTNRR
jgi:hypothetical protein